MKIFAGLPEHTPNTSARSFKAMTDTLRARPATIRELLSLIDRVRRTCSYMRCNFPAVRSEFLRVLLIDNTHGLCRNYTGTLGFAEVNAAGNVVYSSMTDFLRSSE